MKKDTTVAIFVGFIIGLLVAVSFVGIPSILKNGIKFSFQLPKISIQKSSSSPSPSPKILTDNFLDIDSPSSIDELSDKNKIQIAGKTKKNAIVVIDTNLETKVVKAQGGHFSESLNLNEGTNNILITSYMDAESFDSKNFTVSYTPEKF